MRRAPGRWLAALLLALSFVLLVGPQARADDDDTPSSWRITKYHVAAQPQSNGTTKVTVDMDFDFANDPGHGPFIALVTRMRVPNDPDKWRMIDIDLQSVTSGTGANTTTKVTRESGAMVIRVGREGIRHRGVQNYVVTYTATGLVEANNPSSGLDEFNWTALIGGDVPVNNLQVTVQGPAEVQQTACFWGRSMTQACDQAETSDDTATWQLSRLSRGQGMQVVAGFPQGTFSNAEVRFTKRYTLQNMFPVTPTTLVGAGGVGAVGLLAVLALFLRSGRDRAYLDLTPGLAPAANSDSRVGIAAKTPVTVQFHPPKNASPGEVGVLVDERVDNRDVTATILDLAVRGHFTIAQPQIERGSSNFVLTRTPTNDTLAPFEKKLMHGLFGGQQQVDKSDLSKKSKAHVLPDTRSALNARVLDRNWFRGNPNTVRALYVGLGVVALCSSIGASFLLGITGLGLVGLGLVAASIGLLVAAPHMPARTADGSAVLSQAKGFELYLRTAEADTIKFEEGVDVFSKYLPYAVVFGVADRWAKIFQELAEQGRYQADTSWYVGNPMAYAYAGGFGGAVDSLTSSMSSAMASAVSAANASSAGGGSSGFSGGGGFGGGSVGGW